jgi:hypothetical protein
MEGWRSKGMEGWRSEGMEWRSVWMKGCMYVREWRASRVPMEYKSECAVERTSA